MNPTPKDPIVADIGVLTRPLQVFENGTHKGIARMLAN